MKQSAWKHTHWSSINFSSQWKCLAFSITTGPEIGLPSEHLAVNHLYNTLADQS